MKLLFCSLILLWAAVMTSNSPLFMALSIIGMALTTGMIIWLSLSKWLGITMILIFIGGMMVVFIYVTSLAPNVKMKTNLSMNYLWVSSVALLTPLMIDSQISAPFSLFSLSSQFALSFLVIYLLIALFVVAKIAETHKGALAQKN